MENPAGTSDESFLRWRISIEEGDQNVELEEFGSEQLLRTVVCYQGYMFEYSLVKLY